MGGGRWLGGGQPGLRPAGVLITRFGWWWTAGRGSTRFGVMAHLSTLRKVSRDGGGAA